MDEEPHSSLFREAKVYTAAEVQVDEFLTPGNGHSYVCLNEFVIILSCCNSCQPSDSMGMLTFFLLACWVVHNF